MSGGILGTSGRRNTKKMYNYIQISWKLNGNSVNLHKYTKILIKILAFAKLSAIIRNIRTQETINKID